MQFGLFREIDYFILIKSIRTGNNTKLIESKL